MATVLLITSVILSRYFFIRKRALARYGLTETVAGKFWGYAFEVSASLTMALFFYHILLMLLATGWEWISVAQLQRIEQSLALGQRVADRYKVSWLMSLAVLSAWYLFARYWIGFLGRDTPFRVFKKLKTVLHVINTLAFMFASFTLLGFEPGAAATTLEIRLRRERSDYGALRQDLRTALLGETINQAYADLAKALPGSADLPRLIETEATDVQKLVQTYRRARDEYDIHDYPIEVLLKRHTARQSAGRPLEASHPRGGSSRPSENRPQAQRDTLAAGSGERQPVSVEVAPLPGSATYQQVKKARASLDNLKQRLRPHILRLLNRPGGKELILELPKGPVGRIADALDPISEVYPIFRPVFDVMKSTLNDAISVRMQRKLNDLTQEAMQHPERIEASLSRAARELASSEPHRLSSDATQLFVRELNRFRREVGQLRDSSVRLDRAVAKAEALRTKAAETRGRPRSRDTEAPTRSSETSANPIPRNEPRPQTPRSSGSGGSGGYVTGCTCNRYVNGVLVSSFPIPVGASCGGQVCGR